MIFKRPQLADKGWVDGCLSNASGLSCEYTFGNIYNYVARLDVKIAELSGCFASKCRVGDLLSYCYPVGGDVGGALNAIVEDAKGEAFSLFGLSAANARELERLLPGKFDIRLNRDAGDYVYLSSDLAGLEGKKYQQKRNHISYFVRNNRWEYERIASHNIEECIHMGREWLSDCQPDMYEDLYVEEIMIRRAFESYDALGFSGGLLRADGKVIAYTMGEPIDGETFCVHFEKAFAHIRGAYPMINREFVKNELSGYTYVNREDDLGAPNLRKAKLSYHPYKIIEKYDAVYNINNGEGAAT